MKLGRVKTNLSNLGYCSLSVSGTNIVLPVPTSNDVVVVPAGSVTVQSIDGTGLADGTIVNFYFSGGGGDLTFLHNAVYIELLSSLDYVCDATHYLTLMFDYDYNIWREVNKTASNGFQGSQGSMGGPGNPGVQGAQGVQGAGGLGIGQPGEAGAQGQGNADVGAVGADGAPGAQGSTGPAGDPGPSG